MSRPYSVLMSFDGLIPDEYRKNLSKRGHLFSSDNVNFSFCAKPESLTGGLPLNTSVVVTDNELLANIARSKKCKVIQFIRLKQKVAIYRTDDFFIRSSSINLADIICEEILCSIIVAQKNHRLFELKEIIFDDDTDFSLEIAVQVTDRVIDILPLTGLFVDTLISRKIMELFIEKYQNISLSEWKEEELSRIYTIINNTNAAIDKYQFESTLMLMVTCSEKILEKLKNKYGEFVIVKNEKTSDETFVSRDLTNSVEWRFLRYMFLAWGVGSSDKSLTIKETLRLMYQVRVFLSFIKKLSEVSSQLYQEGA